MWQFLYGSDEMFADLEVRARRVCVRFQHQEMPPGTEPARASIGFEVDTRSGRVLLLVEHGLAYDGSSSGVRNWLANGFMTFEDFTQLRSWLGSELRDSFRPTPDVAGQHSSDADILASNEGEHDLDDVGVQGLRIAMRLGCQMKDLPS